MVFSHVEQQIDQQYAEPRSSEDRVSDKYEEIDIVVHPGFSMMNEDYESSVFDWLDETRFGRDSGFTSRDSYQNYLSDLGQLLHESENPTVFLYDENQLGKYRDFIEDKLQPENQHENYFIQTESDSGYIETVEMWEIAGLMDRIEENGTINIHGEQNGRCTDDCIESLEQVSNVLETNTSFEQGTVFPPVRL